MTMSLSRTDRSREREREREREKEKEKEKERKKEKRERKRYRICRFCSHSSTPPQLSLTFDKTHLLCSYDFFKMNNATFSSASHFQIKE
jgi:hypothetical protein